MRVIPLDATPNQVVTARLGGVRFEIRLRDIGGMMAADITRGVRPANLMLAFGFNVALVQACKFCTGCLGSCGTLLPLWDLACRGSFCFVYGNPLIPAYT